MIGLRKANPDWQSSSSPQGPGAGDKFRQIYDAEDVYPLKNVSNVVSGSSDEILIKLSVEKAFSPAEMQTRVVEVGSDV